jgi:hypothetical protein
MATGAAFCHSREGGNPDFFCAAKKISGAQRKVSIKIKRL